MAPYGVAVSDSADFTKWKPYRLLPNETEQIKLWGDHSTQVGCARPKIEAMADGALLLAGGRPSAAKEDPMVWLNAEGDAELWQPYSISYWHNRYLTATDIRLHISTLEHQVAELHAVVQTLRGSGCILILLITEALSESGA